MAASGLRHIGQWVAHWHKRLRVQVARRASIPPHCANGAVEAPVAEGRRMLERRKWCFRNRARMDLLLEVVRMRLRGLDDETAYASRIRDHLARHNGHPPRRYGLSTTNARVTRGCHSLRP